MKKGKLVALTVDVRVDQIVQRVDFGAVLLWVIVERSLLLLDELIESRVEDADNLRALVVDDRMQLLVPEDGNREPMDRR